MSASRHDWEPVYLNINYQASNGATRVSKSGLLLPPPAFLSAAAAFDQRVTATPSDYLDNYLAKRRSRVKLYLLGFQP